MTPAELRRLLTLAEARCTHDLARLDAALAENRRLETEIAELSTTGERDLAEGSLPLARQGARLVWADQHIALARKRRAALASEIAALRAAATRSLGKHRALERILGQSEREDEQRRGARVEREAPPAEPQTWRPRDSGRA